jgi:hypothetical protein
MADAGPTAAQLLQQNVETQLKASDELLAAIRELAEAAQDPTNAAASPTITPQLEKLIRIASELNTSANTAVQSLRLLPAK